MHACVLKGVRRHSKNLHFDMQALCEKLKRTLLDGKGWEKLTRVTVKEGEIAQPTNPLKRTELGVRFIYIGQVVCEDGIYNRFFMKPNAGNIQTTLKKWRNWRGQASGAHTTMAEMFVKRNGSKKDVEKGIDRVTEEVDLGR